MKNMPQQSSEEQDSWPTGSAGERVSYNGYSYVYEYDDSGYWWYISEAGEISPYYVRYDYATTQLWYNGMGNLLDPPPTPL